LEELIAAPAEMEELRSRAQQTARDNYNWETITTAYERLLADMLH